MGTSVLQKEALVTLAVTPTPEVAEGLAAGWADGQTERDAQLLVCGAYPDKKLVVTERDLDDIVAAFHDGTVPIKVEHVDSPLDPLGTVRRLWRDGPALLGTIGFDAAVTPFLAKRPVGRLSVGLDRDAATQKLSLAEVSLVLKPRLATALLLSEGNEALTPNPSPASGRGESEKDAEIGRLRAQLTRRDVDEKLGELKRQGKVVPAIELLARALLSAGDGARITLSDGSAAGVADTAFRLLQALPPLVTFSETAPGTVRLFGGPGGAATTEEDDEDGAPELTPAQQAYCRDVLKVDPAVVRRTMLAQGRPARKGQ